LAFENPFGKNTVGSYKDGGMATNKGTTIPLQVRTGPEDSRFQGGTVVSCTHRSPLHPHLPGNIPGTHFC